MPETTAELNQSPKRLPLLSCGLVVIECRHGPGFYGELNDNFAKFHLLISGRAVWESGNVNYSVMADTLFHISANVPHRQRDLAGQPVTLYAIHYLPSILRADLYEDLSRVGMLPIALRGQYADQGRQVRAIVQEMLFEQEAKRFGWDAVLVARLTDLAVVMARLKSGDKIVIDRTNDSMTRVSSYAMRLKDHFYSPVSLDDAARSVGLGRRRFTELFRKVTGQSWQKHIHQLRMEYAAKLLSYTDRSVTAIAFECGFEELSHFHHSFKDTFDTTPLTYRKNARGRTTASAGQERGSERSETKMIKR